MGVGGKDKEERKRGERGEKEGRKREGRGEKEGRKRGERRGRRESDIKQRAAD